jgi:hypothetical protein
MPRNTNVCGGSIAEALSEADLDRLEQSKIPDETKKLDHLVPEKW